MHKKNCRTFYLKTVLKLKINMLFSFSLQLQLRPLIYGPMNHDHDLTLNYIYTNADDFMTILYTFSVLLLFAIQNKLLRSQIHTLERKWISCILLLLGASWFHFIKVLFICKALFS